MPVNTLQTTRYFLYGLTMSFPPLAFIFISPIVGIASDLYGRKKVLLLCLCASFLGFILPIVGIIKHWFMWILIGRLIGGASTASQPVAQAAVTDCTKNHKTKSFYLSIIAFAMTLGLLLGPIVGSYLSDSQIVGWFSVKTPLYIGAILTVMNLIFLIYGYNPFEKVKKFKKNFFIEHKLFRKFFKKNLLILLSIFFLVEFSWSLYYQSVYLIFPSILKYTTEEVSLLTAYAGVCMCIGLIFIYPILLNYFKPKRIATASLIAMFISFLSAQFVVSYVLFLTITFIAIFTGIAYVSFLSLISENLDEYSQGWGLGVAGTTLALAWAITGFLSGILENIKSTLSLEMCLIAVLIAILINFICKYCTRIHSF